ncbi:MAG: hypothetical protein DELT_02985 [Desulfovibrio sp.]
MASRFWTYFHDKLRWGLIHSPGPISALVKGLAHRLDVVRDDALFLRDQGFPQLCEPEVVPYHGDARGIVRHHTETPEQFRQRVVNAFAWHMLGGKQQGVPEILRFYGFDIAEIVNMRKFQPARWAEFQVGLHNPANLADQNAILATLETLVWLINEYKPARSILARLYTDIYNITPLIWSEGQYSEHFYSHFSGVPASDIGDGDWKNGGLIVSFGLRYLTEAERVDYGAPTFSGLQQQGFVAPYIDSPVWSYFNYSDDFPQRHGFTVGELLSVDWSVQTTTSYRWAGKWDERHWREKSRWDRELPKWYMRDTDISRSQLFYSDTLLTPQAGLWGGLNACYSRPTAVLIDNPPIWGNSRYSEDTERREIVIHEQFINRRGMTTESASPGTPEALFSGVICSGTEPRHNQTWSGKWDSRRWYNYRGSFAVASYTKESEQ